VGSDIVEPKQFIKNWMEHRKVFVSEADKTPEDFTFVLNGNYELEIPFTILQPKAWETSIMVLSEARMGEQHVAALKSMRSKDRKEFLDNLIKEISFAPAIFAFDPEFEKTGIPAGIQFSREICYDGLTEDKLSECMYDVTRCLAFVIRQFKKEFEDFKGE
jgi:hypothetical protein